MPLDLNVSHETFNAISEYVNLLKKWNVSINLIGQNDIGQIYERHIKDILLFKDILEKSENENHNILDVGSGNGLPGIILSIIMPKYRLYLNDIDQRKCAFLQEVIVKLRLNAEPVCTDIKKLDTKEFSVITAKAFTSLQNMLVLMKHNWGGKKLYMMKGIRAEKEIEEAQKKWDFNVKINELSPKSFILCVSEIKRKHG